MSVTDSKTRFSSRVDDYVKYRPTYPNAALDALRDRIGLRSDWLIADVGCGTGISSRLFVENGNEVFGIEPNADMRAAAVASMADNSRFHPIDGSAEHTALPDESVDLVLAAQAWHWFDHLAAAREFRRILRSTQGGGWALCMWNSRMARVSAFALAYDELLNRYGTDYRHVSHRSAMRLEDFTQAFGVSFERIVVPNSQSLDAEGLAGRVRSSSYTPLPGQAGHDSLFAGIADLFAKHQDNGLVRFDYETELFVGRLRG